MALVTWLLRKHFSDWEETLLGILLLLVDLKCYDSFLLFPLPTQKQKVREKTKHFRSTRSSRIPRRVSSQSEKCFLSNQVTKAN